jgi:hypothetical protein
MRYVVVQGRIPRGLPRFCAFCCEPIRTGYTRNVTTCVVYCRPDCAERHAAAAKHAAPMLPAGIPTPMLQSKRLLSRSPTL